MKQDDLFAPPPPVLERCGGCVHRNAPASAALGYCTPVGWRGCDDPPCDQGFPTDELNAALYGRNRP